MRELMLPLKGEYFNAIRDGSKTEEYREANEYWTKRLYWRLSSGHIEPRTYDRIVLTWGYPKADDAEKRLVLPWKGFVKKIILHKHFGPMPVFVYAIDVSH